MKRIPKTLIATLAALTLAAFASTTLFAQAPPKPTSTKAPAASAKATKAPKAPRAAKPAFEGKVALNTATAEQLEKLPRVGPKLAQRIVEYRTQHTAFRSVDELRNVKGVGAKMLESLRPHLTL